MRDQSGVAAKGVTASVAWAGSAGVRVSSLKPQNTTLAATAAATAKRARLVIRGNMQPL